MKRSSSASEIFSGVLARGDLAEQISGRAWLQAMLDFEAGLARAQARERVITPEEADAIVAACAIEHFEAGAIGAAAGEIGNPAGPVVAALKQATDAPVHKGATSQDVIDTAAMLVIKRALPVLIADLRAAADAAAELAKTHRDTPIIGRTLLQHAVPTTFGLKAAGWMSELDAARAGLAAYRPLVQLGGPAGTLASLRGAGYPLRAALAIELDLCCPVLPWHTLRSPIGELAGLLGVAAGAVGKAARDITLLAQTEVGEVREGTGGGSTSMPHKHNPVAAIAALGCTLQAPAFVAALLGAMVQEHERAAGAWHSEWRPLNDLLVTTGSAAAWLKTSLEGLEIDVERMRANLGDTAPDPGEAGNFVNAALATRP